MTSLLNIRPEVCYRQTFVDVLVYWSALFFCKEMEVWLLGFHPIATMSYNFMSIVEIVNTMIVSTKEYSPSLLESRIPKYFLSPRI